MLRTLDLLKKSKIVKSYDVLDQKQGVNSYYIKVKATLIDDSILDIREYVSKNKIIYSYNWRNKNGNLICRWDNSPHYRNIKTFPHHKHMGSEDNIKESYETNLEDVLRRIEEFL